MMTRLQYIERKRDIEARMKQTRKEESEQRKAIDDARIEQDKREYQEYIERKHQRAAECKAKCDEISEHFKDVRRAIWTEDVELVEEWRGQLRTDEVKVTPPTTDGLMSDSATSSLTKEEPKNEDD